MDFGIALAPRADSWKTVKRAEELGFSHAWFYDSQLLYTDVFVAMTLAAEHTRRIRLAPGVLIPSNRIAPSAANAVASLQQLAPGRVELGIGTGFTGRRTMGLGAMRLGELKEYVRILRALWRGESIEWEFEGVRRKIRFLDPEQTGFELPLRIPVHVSAFGPKSRQLTAEIGDGWCTFSFSDAGSIADLEDLRRACRDRGRDAAELDTTAFTLGCVLEPGEDPGGPRALAQAGPQAAAGLHNFVEAQERGSVLPLPPQLEPLVKAYASELYAGYQPADARYLSLHRGHLLSVRPDEARFIGGELIRATTFTGGASELRERIRGLRDAGFSQWTVQLVAGHEDAIDDWAELVAGV
jgi:5,10-methylenetetrahydromethanopterin reductase